MDPQQDGRMNVFMLRDTSTPLAAPPLPDGITIHQADLGYAQWLAALYRFAYWEQQPSPEAYEHLERTRNLEQTTVIQAMKTLLTPNRGIFVARIADKLAAFLDVGRPRARHPLVDELDPTAAWAFELYVFPRFRRSGVATALLAAAIDWARSRGRRLIGAEIYPRNVTGLRFATSVGFEPVDRVYARRGRSLPMSPSWPAPPGTVVNGIRTVDTADVPVQIHLGRRPRCDKFTPISMEQPRHPKQPAGGFWTCTYTARGGEFAKSSRHLSFMHDRTWWRDDPWWLLWPQPGARLVVIDSYDDLVRTYARYPWTDHELDFPAMARDGYAGLWLTRRGGFETYKLAGLDLLHWTHECVVWFDWYFDGEPQRIRRGPWQRPRYRYWYRPAKEEAN